MATSADLGIPFVASQQATPEITHNEALYLLQALLNGVIDMGRNTPPVSPVEGDSYIIGTSPTGAWVGKSNCIAIYTSGGWRFMPGNNSAGTPIAIGARHEGLRVWNRATDSVDYWTGSAWASMPPPAFRGALVKKNADQTAANYTTDTAVAWDTETYDAGAWHDNATNNSRLTVPAGVSRVRVTGSIYLGSVTSEVFVLLSLRKNGSASFDGAAANICDYGGTDPAINIQSPVLEVSPGDYFELFLLIQTDTSVTVVAARSSFAIEAVS